VDPEDSLAMSIPIVVISTVGPSPLFWFRMVEPTILALKGPFQTLGLGPSHQCHGKFLAPNRAQNWRTFRRGSSEYVSREQCSPSDWPLRHGAFRFSLVIGSSGLESTYKEVTDHVRDESDRAEALANDKQAGTIAFTLTILQRRFASSPQGIYQSLRCQSDRLQKRLSEGELLQRGAAAEAITSADNWFTPPVVRNAIEPGRHRLVPKEQSAPRLAPVGSAYRLR